MRRLIVAVMLAAVVFTNAARAQTFACQYVMAAGLQWNKGKWSVTGFEVLKPFFLRLEAGTITSDSATKVLFGPVKRCEVEGVKHTCTDRLGAFLFFDSQRAEGGVASLVGTVGDFPTFRDSVTVSPFTCQKM